MFAYVPVCVCVDVHVYYKDCNALLDRLDYMARRIDSIHRPLRADLVDDSSIDDAIICCKRF